MARHLMSQEDQEMFAYNRRQERIKQHFDWPENAIRYSVLFLGHDAETDAKCFSGMYANIALCDGIDIEQHF